MKAQTLFLILVGVVLMGVPLWGWSAPVTFNDTALLNAVKTQWEAATGLALSDPPEDTELANAAFTELTAKGLGIADLTGLEACTSLTGLNLGMNQIASLDPIAGLTGLVNLDLGMGFDPMESDEELQPGFTGANLITDLAPLAGLINLEYLSLMGNGGITDITALSTMDSLSILWFSANPISSFAPLSDVADTLEFVAFMNCGVANADIPILNGMTNLAMGIAFISELNLTDISGLTGINPSFFLLMESPITDISVVANYTNLTDFDVEFTPITALPNLSGLTNLTIIYLLANNVLTDISGIANLTSLDEVIINECPLSDIGALATCTGLRRLDLEDNQITDIQPLLDNPNIGNLQTIEIRNNPFAPGTPFCDENQLAQLRALAPAAWISHNAICGEAVTLTLSLNGVGDTEPDPGVITVPANEYASLNAYPIAGSGYAFDNWTGDMTSTFNYVQIFMDTDKNIAANFVPGDWTLTINETGPSAGGIWPNPGEYSYLDGRTAYVNLEDNYGGAYFSGWSGDATGFIPNLQLVMDADKTVTANFVDSGYTLTLDRQGSGNIEGFYGNGPFYFASGAAFNLVVQSSAMGYRFDHWEGDLPSGADPNDPELPVLMDQDRSITAVFVQDTRTLTIIIDGPGATNPPGSADPGTQYEYSPFQNACIFSLPGAESAFGYWSGDIAGSPPTYYMVCVNMDQDRTIIAHFVEADWSLTLEASGNGTTYPAPGAYGYTNGAWVNFNAVLVSGGDAFSHWSGDIGASEPERMFIGVSMDQDRTVTANFTPGDWTLTLAKTGPPSGGVSPLPGTYAYMDGQTATLGATSNSSAYFAGWTGDVETDSPSVDVVMDSDKDITANFTDSGFILVVDIIGQGWTNLPTTSYFASGTEPVISAHPQNGWTFDYWSGNLPSGADEYNPELTVLMDQNRNITAHFIQRLRTLTIIIIGEGTTTPAGAPDPGLEYDYVEGTHVWLNAEPGMNGWAFNGWSGDIGSADPAIRSFSVTMDQDRTVIATYVAADWLLALDYTGNGSTWPAPGTYGFLDGAAVEVVANIATGSDAFDHWEGVPEGANIYDPGQRFNIHSDMTLTAVFTPGDYTLTTTIAGGGTTEYVSHPAGVYQYLAGRNAHIEVRPWHETYWGGYSGDITTFDYTVDVLMDGDKNITITLGTSGYELVVNQTGGGITDPSGAWRFVPGATPTIHAIDNGSSLFANWSGELPPDVDPTVRDPVILMDQHRTVFANFEQADWYLYIQASGNGTTDPVPDLYWFVEGAPFEITATPGADTLFLRWQGDVPESQDPTALTISGTMTQNRELIAVFVPTTVAVPDLSGMTQDEAANALAYVGLALGTVTEEYSSLVPSGQVISQDPEAETVVDYGSVVSIVISLGPCYASVPNLAGMTQADAETALAAANLTLGTVAEENSEFVPEGQVIRQQPVYGLLVACGSAVNIVISLGIGGEGSAEGPHTADQDSNGVISLSELLRVIQFFNSSGLHCQSGTEDGYAPGPGDQTCAAHDSDYNPQDWLINLSELLRIIQFFNSGGYHACPGEGTEDGFCPGLG